jgi:hypothetical protein
MPKGENCVNGLTDLNGEKEKVIPFIPFIVPVPPFVPRSPQCHNINHANTQTPPPSSLLPPSSFCIFASRGVCPLCAKPFVALLALFSTFLQRHPNPPKKDVGENSWLCAVVQCENAKKHMIPPN